jgi:hypothetical protein
MLLTPGRGSLSLLCRQLSSNHVQGSAQRSEFSFRQKADPVREFQLRIELGRRAACNGNEPSMMFDGIETEALRI